MWFQLFFQRYWICLNNIDIDMCPEITQAQKNIFFSLTNVWHMVPEVFWSSEAQFVVRIVPYPVGFRKIPKIFLKFIKCRNLLLESKDHSRKSYKSFKIFSLNIFYIFEYASELRNGSPQSIFRKLQKVFRKPENYTNLWKQFCPTN